MEVIRCTQKLQKEMGLTKKDLIEPEVVDYTLGCWFANMIFINRKKCIVFVNEKTLFNFIVCDLSRTQIRKLDKIFLQHLETNLSEENIDQKFKSKIMSEYQEIVYGKTNSRRLLGIMNELVSMYTYSIIDAGGVHNFHIPEIIKNCNRTIFSLRNYIYPIEILKEIIQGITLNEVMEKVKEKQEIFKKNAIKDRQVKHMQGNKSE